MSILPDYREDPEAYEIEERSRPDEMIMIDRANEWASLWLDQCEGAFALDLCCGTGLSMRSMVEHPNVVGVTGVDSCLSYLDYARSVFKESRTPPILIHDDAVAISNSKLGRNNWDLVMLSSAYHHVEDERKVKFLRRVHELIGSNGRALMAENVLPNYQDDRTSYHAAVGLFYQEVLRTARLHNPQLPLYVTSLIERVAQYGYDGEYEYKVCMPILQEHLSEANLLMVDQVRVWPEDDSTLGEGGNFVFLLRAG